jgi:hypothetical protein
MTFSENGSPENSVSNQPRSDHVELLLLLIVSLASLNNRPFRRKDLISIRLRTAANFYSLAGAIKMRQATRLSKPPLYSVTLVESP